LELEPAIIINKVINSNARQKKQPLPQTGEDIVMKARNSAASPAASSAADAAAAIIELTDRICTSHLDAEYAELCRKLIGKLARKRPSPVLRGAPHVWAGAVIQAVGTVNFLFDRTQRPHMTHDGLSTITGAAKTTLGAKSRLICDWLRIGPFSPEFCRRELLPNNPLVWLVQVNGLIVDARQLPPDLQAEARRKGLIPDIPHENKPVLVDLPHVAGRNEGQDARSSVDRAPYKSAAPQDADAQEDQQIGLPFSGAKQ